MKQISIRSLLPPLVVSSLVITACGSSPRVAEAPRDSLRCPAPSGPAPATPPTVSITEASLSGARRGVRVHAAASAQVESVRVYVEGRHVATKAVCAKEKDIEVEVPLVGVRSRVSAYAFDSTGVASAAATLDLSTQAQPPRKPDVWIVAAGANTFPNLGPSAGLNGAVGDAQTIARAFRAQAGEGKPYGNAHEAILVDASFTRAGLLSALDGLSAMHEDDLAVVSLSSHGMKHNTETYIVTSESGPPADVANTSLAFSQVAESLRRARGRVLVLVDTSYAGGFGRGDTVPNAAMAARLEGEKRAGVVVFAASRADEVGFELGERTRALPLVLGGLDTDGSTGGVFVSAVVATLTDPSKDVNHNGAIDLTELVQSVSERVSQSTSGKQHPELVRREQLGDFTLAAFGTCRSLGEPCPNTR